MSENTTRSYNTSDGEFPFVSPAESLRTDMRPHNHHQFQDAASFANRGGGRVISAFCEGLGPKVPAKMTQQPHGKQNDRYGHTSTKYGMHDDCIAFTSLS